MRPQFKAPEDFMVIRAGNSLRIKMSYEVRVNMAALGMRYIGYAVYLPTYTV